MSVAPDFVLETIIDGKVETTKTVKRGDVVITGPKKEQYSVDCSKFLDLYDVNANVAVPRPLPKRVYHATATAFKQATVSAPLSFTTAWGEKMALEKGDYLVEEGLRHLDGRHSGVFQAGQWRASKYLRGPAGEQGKEG